jgi:hypothetical protein
VSAALASTASAAVIISQWTFETSQPVTAGPFSPEVGSGSALGLHAGAAVYSTPAGNGSSHSFSSNTWAVGDYYQFGASTVGNTGIDVEWDQTGSATGPSQFQLQYSTDGTIFNNVGSPYTIQLNGAPNTPWGAGNGVQALYHYAVDLSSIPGLDNNPNAAFRLVDNSATAINGGTVASGGTDRVDNLTIESGPLPEPASLGALAVLGLLGARRRR